MQEASRLDRGYQSDLRVPWPGIPGLALVMAMCRDGGDGLAHLMKRVPDEYVSRACTIGRGPEVWVVRCVCGETRFVAAALVECACSRWFVADERGVWSIRLPEQEPDDA